MDDPFLLIAFGLAVNGALFFDSYRGGENPMLSILVQAAFWCVVMFVVYLGVIIAGMERYAVRFKVQETKLHEEHDEFGPESFGSAPYQNGVTTNDLLLLMSRAANIASDFDTRVLDVLLVSGAALGRAAEKAGPSLKGEGRAREKAANDYDGDYRMLGDLLRGTIILDNFSDLVACFVRLQQLDDDGVIRILRIKNRFLNGSIAGAGYCDANLSVEFEGHVCEVQLQYRPFYELKKGQHKVYEVVRSLQIEGGLAEIPEAAFVSPPIRIIVLLLLLFSGAAGLWQSTLFRFYNWCSFGTWNANQYTADPHAAVLMGPFLLLFYVSLAHIWRSLRCHSWSLALAGQATSAVGIVIFGLRFDPSILLITPSSATWFPLRNYVGLWSLESSFFVYGDETITYLWAPDREENTVAVLIPHVMVGLLFLRDLVSTLRWKGVGTRPRSRVGMLYDEFLGPRGVYFEHRLVLQQLATVVLQATQKLPVLGAAAWSVDVTRSPVLGVDNGIAKIAYWMTVGALVVNALYPAVLLQWARPATQRTASMGLDAALDIVYFSVFSASMHRVVGAASAPSNIVAYLATFYPAFHAFSVAIGLELSTMQDEVLTEEAQAKVLARKKTIRRPIVWGLALSKIGIISFAMFHLCAGMFPMKVYSDTRCDPCVCRESLSLFTQDGAALLEVLSCDAVAFTLPNEFHLSGRKVAEVGRKVFGNSGFDGLAVVDLSDNPISSILSLPPFLQRLDLARCKMDDNAIASVAASLMKGKSRLTDLVLQDNDIGADGMAAIAASLRHATELSILNFQSNYIGADGAIAVGGMLKDKLKLTQLWLGGNSLGNDGVTAIAASLLRATELSDLDLQANSISVDGAKAVADMLEDKLKLFQLRLGSNNLADDGVAAIESSLVRATELSELYLEHNSISAHGALAVAAMVEDKSKLSVLRLAHNNISDDGATLIAASLGRATELVDLDLQSNSIGVDGAVDIAAMLEDKWKLSRLHLGSNDLGDDGAWG
jgi:Ran GTPase-activating protein (RanGAP) involved in mRNA processing and transport